MYTVNKGPSKFVAKTRGGLSKNIEKFETIREISRKCSADQLDSMEMSVPRPVFHQSRNSRTYYQSGSNLIKEPVQQQTPPSPQHEELVKFIQDSWNVVVASNPYDDMASSADCSSASSTSSLASSMGSSSSTNSSNSRAVYHNDPPSAALKDFGAFDLESWWGRRLFNNITKTL